MKKMILAANWKLHKSPKQSRSYLKEFIPQWREFSSRHEVWFFPPSLCLGAFTEITASVESLSFGLQNFWKEGQGAYTGENSLVTAQELGATVALVGHSERRQIFGETSDLLRAKIQYARDRGVRVLACVGETLDERTSGRTEEVLRTQVRELVDGLSPFSLALAYEPVWAIGTGQVATPEQVVAAHGILKLEMSKIWGDEGLEVPILYGGSVKPENGRSLFSGDGVDGFLVGGASLEVATFLSILRNSI